MSENYPKVESYSDEEIERYLRKQGYARTSPETIYWLCDNTAVDEILKRYKATKELLENKKQECEELRESAAEMYWNLSQQIYQDS